MRISEHLYMLCGAPYGQTGNVYAIQGEEGFFLIDCGRDTTALDIIMGNIGYYHLLPGMPSHVLLTHAHFDHSGNTWYFQKNKSLIAAHTREADALEQGGELVSDYTVEDTFQTCHVDKKLEHKDTLTVDGISISVIHAPGHSAGSVLYQLKLDDRLMLFTGDTVSTRLDGWGELRAELGWEGGYDYNRTEYLETLHQIYQMPIDCILPGHGIPAMCNGRKILKDAFCTGLLSLR